VWYSTSVLNRRQPLNGSNILFLVCIFFLSNSANSQTTGNAVKATSVNTKTINNTLLSDTASEVSNFKPGQKEFTIALLLPFEGSKVYINNLDDPSTYYFPEESQLAAAYYQGCVFALDSLAKSGLRARLLVYDVGMDTSALRGKLFNDELKNVDLIIGPVGNNSLRIITEYANRNKIWLVSPFSTTAIGSAPGPYYVLANATMKTHCEKTIDYISKTAYQDKLILIYKKRPWETELVSYLKEYQLSQQADGKRAIEFVELTDSSVIKYTHVKNVLSDSGRNIIIIPSNDETFVRSVIKQLNGLAEEYLITVYGMPTWTNFEHITTEQFAKVSTHITQNFWLDKSNAAVIRLQQSYAAKYAMNPANFAIKGYDQVLYFGELLLKNGADFHDAFSKHNGYGLAEHFTIEPKRLPGSAEEIWYYENKSVFMLRMEDNAWKKVSE
jgi:hypothetical protein